MEQKRLVTGAVPSERLAECLMSSREKRYCTALKEIFNIQPISLHELGDISGEERFHADMIAARIGGGKYFTASSEAEINRVLRSYGAQVTEVSGITAKEPKLNICYLGDKIICDTRHVSSKILSACAENNIRVLHTNQRYAGCSCAVVASSAIITADPSIILLCRENSIDVLPVSQGDVKLKGYEYGFIGGACGMASADCMVFFGDLLTHRDHKKITAFLSHYGVRAVSLGEGALCDIGGIVPVTEYIKKLVRK